MCNSKKLAKIKDLLNILLISLFGCAGIVFSVLYIDTFSSGFWYDNSTIMTAVTVSIISVLTMLSITFLNHTRKFIHKLFFLFVVLLFLIICALYFIKITGFLDQMDSVDDFRQYVSSFGSYAIILFVVIQFLQVVVLPIPAFITVGAGVLLFGPFLGSILSCIGIILGSIVAFFIGRIFGIKVARWLVGEDNLRSWLKKIKGKDKVVLTFMFLFPFFPDDVLCFVCGITSMSKTFFLVMIFIVRIITVFISSYSMNNSIIPYDTWWGIALWIVFFALTILLTVFIYNKGDKIEKIFFNKRKKTRNNHDEI